MKQTKHILLMAAMLLCSLSASADPIEIDGIWYNLVSKVKTAEVTFKGDSYDSYSGEYSGSITIPATVTHEGTSYSVTSIGDYAFYGCRRLTTITIPEGVTSIGSYAFDGCIELSSITIPENSKLTSIGKYAFIRCSSLTAITIPEGVTSIEGWAFDGCSSLTAITIPEGVTSIGSYAFDGCSSLTAVHISSIEAWCKISFDDFNKASNPLSYAHNLYLNGELITELVIPEGVTSIDGYAFCKCTSLTTITIPEGVTSIGSYAFDGCIELSSITIPESVTSIGGRAFDGCSSLTTIVLPKSVEYIWGEAFAGCPELTDVYCYAEDVPRTEADAFDGSYIEYATLHVPASAMNSYKTTAPWSEFGTIVELGASITRITLDRVSATLTEGNELTLTMTTTPDDADRNLISWSSSNPSVATVDNTGKVTAIAPGTATITATANDGCGASAQCEVTVNELILGKCATPTINYEDGKVVFACDTEGAIVKSNFIENIAGSYNDMEVAFIPTYTLTAYAIKEKYEDSDVATLTLCWIPCAEEHYGEESNILTIPAKPVLISTQGGTITVSGLADGTEVTVCSTAGTQLDTATATDGTATITTNLAAGSVAVVQIGGRSVKVAIK